MGVGAELLWRSERTVNEPMIFEPMIFESMIFESMGLEDWFVDETIAG
jgi:hypothetical protein